MPNLAKVLKDEIARIAKREAKQMVAAQAKITSDLKHKVSGLKKQVEALEKSQKPVEKAIAKIQPELIPATPAESTTNPWFTGKGIRSIRNRLGLTQPMFGKLLGVGVSRITKWENTQGKVGIQRANRDKLSALREMTKQEAWEKLGRAPEKAAASAGKSSAKPERTPGTLTGEHIQAIRKRLGLTQKAFGQKLGYSQKGVSNWEAKKGRLKLPAKTLAAIEKLGG